MARRHPTASAALRRLTLTPLLVLALLTGGCATLDPPPITAQPTGAWTPGKIVWHDLLVERADDVVPFYTQLFDWSAQTRGRYTVLWHAGRPVAGVAEIPGNGPEPVVARWLASFSVPDVDRAAARVVAGGGAVHEDPRDLPRRGRFALVSDAQGAKLILLRAKDGDPTEGEAEPGDWLWDELWSNAPQAALDFYQHVGGYAAQSVGSGYWVLERDGLARGGVRDVPREDLEVRWVPAVRVADPVAAGERAAALGGQLIVKAGDPPSDGSVALIADPAGALLMVQRWSEAPGQEGR